jgi:predicted DNA-binding transcriptional regulator AlpA
MRTESVSDVGQQAAPASGRAEAEGYIDKHECARRLGRTVRSVDTYMLKGIVPFYKLGRTVAFKWSEVDEHIKAHFRVCLRG